MSGDKSLFETKGEYFNDEDFQPDTEHDKRAKKVTHKDVIRKHAENKIKNESEASDNDS